MSKSSSLPTFHQGRNQRFEVKIRPHRSPWVQGLLVVWRWRIEIALCLLLWAYLSWAGDNGLTIWPALGALLVPVVIAAAIGPVRRYGIAWVWVQITRHRLRSYLSEAGVVTRSGKLPWLIWVRPTPVGERVTVWLVTGLSFTDLERATEGIAAACWARDARVARTRRLATLVKVDVLRRDPLGASRSITNPITRGRRSTPAATGDLPEVTAVPLRTPIPDRPSRPALSVDSNTASEADVRNRQTDELPRIPVPESPAEPVDPAGAKPTKTTRSSRKPDPTPPPAGPAGAPAVIVNGEDVSDYV